MHHNYYIYLHIREDNNEVFYVGMGKSPKSNKIYGFNTKYSRAFEKTKRSEFWKNIVKKTSYKVEIIFETNSKIEAENKEVELINYYGRRCFNEGNLVNFQSGGNYNDGPRKRGIKIVQLDINTEEVIKIWEELSLIENELGFLKTNIVKCCRKKQKTAYNFKWKYLNNKNFDNIKPSSARKKTSNKGLTIEIYDNFNNNLVKEVFSQKEAAEFLKVSRSTINNYLSGKSKNKYFNIKYSNW